MEMIRFLISIVHLICVKKVICKVGSYSPSAFSFFQNKTTFRRTVGGLFPTELPVKSKTKLVPSNVECLANFRKGLFSCEESGDPTLGSCGCALWGFKDILASLQDCEWEQTVLVTSETITDSGKHCGSRHCLPKLEKRISTSHHNRNLSYDEATSSRKNFSYRDQIQKDQISHNILAAFRALLIPLQHVLVSSANRKNLQKQLEEIIWTSYSSKRVRNFVWISHRPWEILEAADIVFRRHRRGRGALMAHKALFLLVGVGSTSMSTSTSTLMKSIASPRSSHLLKRPSCTPPLLKETENHLVSSAFDNVLFLSSTNYLSNSGDFVNDKFCFSSLPHTLMWRGNRTREFETVPKFYKDSSQTTLSRFNRRHNDRRMRERNCKMFPNIRTGMNGRHLILLTKEWENVMTVYDDGSSLHYSGLLCEIAKVLSVSMNFTFTLQPDPMVSRNLTWGELEDMMISGGVGDALLSLYYITASLALNFSQPHPIFHSNMTAAYVSRPHAHIIFSIYRLSPQIIIFFGAAFGLALIYYTYLCNASELYSSCETRQATTDVQSSCDPNYFKVFLRQSWLMVFALFGSCFSQSNIPQTLLFSGRIFLFSWCMFILMLTAIIKGHLASSLIRVNPPPPITTFRELVDGTDHRWGHFKDSTFLPVMAAAKGETLSQLYSRMMRFAEDDPGILASSIDALVRKTVEDEHFVAIIDSFYLKKSKHALKIPYIKVIPESLGPNGFSLALPLDSELTELMSEHILALYETDIFNVLADNMFRQLKNNATDNTTLLDKIADRDKILEEKENYKIDIMWGLMFCACLLLVATFILLLELSLVRTKPALLSRDNKT